MTATDAQWVRSGLLRVSAKAEVEAPPTEVWKVLTDAETWTSWYEGIDTFELVSADLHLGARMRLKEWLFRYEAEIVEWEPEKALGFTYVASSFSFLLAKNAERIEIRPGAEPGRCVIEHSGRFSLNWLGWLMAPYALGQIFGYMYFDFRAAARGLARLVGSKPVSDQAPLVFYLYVTYTSLVWKSSSSVWLR